MEVIEFYIEFHNTKKCIHKVATEMKDPNDEVMLLLWLNLQQPYILLTNPLFALKSAEYSPALDLPI